MNELQVHTDALTGPVSRPIALSPSRLDAWDRCPRAYVFESVQHRPLPDADHRPRLIGLAGHAILEEDATECGATRRGRHPDRLPEITRALSQSDRGRGTSTGIDRDAVSLLTPVGDTWAVPIGDIGAIEHRVAVTRDTRLEAWDRRLRKPSVA